MWEPRGPRRPRWRVWLSGIGRMPRLRVLNRVQRARRGWGVIDRWNLGHHLAMVISTSTADLAATAWSHPGSMSGDEWSEVLGRISRGFSHYGYYDMTPEQREELDEALVLLREHFDHLWD
jgi:hypothetical protein